MIDLHCHSRASDGLLAPSEVVEAARNAGLAAIALTDHDTTAGLDEARAAGARHGVEVVGGCEFSVATSWGEMHLLGYFLTPGDAAIEEFLVRARDDRARRVREILSRLGGIGIRVSLDDVARECGGDAFGRPHVARALLRLGRVRTVQEAFDLYLGRGRPAFVEKNLPPCRDVVALVHARGGVLSAAHLKTRATEAHARELRDDGVDALETRHPSHSPDIRALVTDLAFAFGFARSGGSDWHGESDPMGTHAPLGSQHVPDEWLTLLRARVPVAEAG